VVSIKSGSTQAPEPAHALMDRLKTNLDTNGYKPAEHHEHEDYHFNQTHWSKPDAATAAPSTMKFHATGLEAQVPGIKATIEPSTSSMKMVFHNEFDFEQARKKEVQDATITVGIPSSSASGTSPASAGAIALDTTEKKQAAQQLFVKSALETFTQPLVQINMRCADENHLIKAMEAINMMRIANPKVQFDLKGLVLDQSLRENLTNNTAGGKDMLAALDEFKGPSKTKDSKALLDTMCNLTVTFKEDLRKTSRSVSTAHSNST